jgi:hypothetical protein
LAPGIRRLEGFFLATDPYRLTPTFFINRRPSQTDADFFAGRPGRQKTVYHAGRAIKKSAIVCVGLAVNIEPPANPV